MPDDPLPAQRGGAKALLLTVLGEFVLPSGGAAWTSSLLAAADTLGIGEKNARQALARIADDGLIEADRLGRRVRWSLTAAGRALLDAGAARIYTFGLPDTETAWDRTWLLAHCPVAETRRSVRHHLRTRLSFLGFGELSATLVVSPHVGREPALRATLADLELVDESIVLRSTTASAGADADLAARAWDLDQLAADYRVFDETHRRSAPADVVETFAAVVELVHDWRRFPFVDPELPNELLPERWAGAAAAQAFHERHRAWAPGATEWFASIDGTGAVDAER